MSNPELACQTIACICEATESDMLEKPAKSEVLWRENGDAYCPEGFALRRAEPEDEQFLEKHGG